MVCLALKLSVSPAANATGTIEAHLIPRLNLGVSALGDTVKANVFLELDANAALVLELDAKTSSTLDNGSTNGTETATTTSASEYETGSTVSAGINSALNYSTQASVYSTSSASVSASQGSPTSSTSGSESSSVDEVSTDAISYVSSTFETASVGTARYRRRQGQPTPVVEAARPTGSVPVSASSGVGGSFVAAGGSNASADTSSSLGGCFSVNAGLDVNVGAEGSFFNIFDKSVSETLFSKDFELFQVGMAASRSHDPTQFDF